jgi:hypothetical protein
LWDAVLPRGDAGGSGKVVLADGLSAAGVGHFVSRKLNLVALRVHLIPLKFAQSNKNRFSSLPM